MFNSKHGSNFLITGCITNLMKDSLMCNMTGDTDESSRDGRHLISIRLFDVESLFAFHTH